VTKLQNNPNLVKLPHSVLTLLMVLCIVTPVALIAYLWLTSPKVKISDLDASIAFERVDGEPMMVFTNESDDKIDAIEMRINYSFFFSSPSTLNEHESLTIALNDFTRKAGGMRFLPEEYPLTSIDIHARRKDSSRGVLKQRAEPGKHLLEPIGIEPAS